MEHLIGFTLAYMGAGWLVAMGLMDSYAKHVNGALLHCLLFLAFNLIGWPGTLYAMRRKQPRKKLC